jgi:hypothetical protein
MLLVETAQEVTRHGKALPRGSSSIPFLNQMILQF